MNPISFAHKMRNISIMKAIAPYLCSITFKIRKECLKSIEYPIGKSSKCSLAITTKKNLGPIVSLRRGRRRFFGRILALLKNRV